MKKHTSIRLPLRCASAWSQTIATCSGAEAKYAVLRSLYYLGGLRGSS